MKRKSRRDGLVYSTGTPPPDLSAPESGQNTQISGKPEAVLRIEKKGRGGKVVTVVALRNVDHADIKPLVKRLKSFCGTGGTAKAMEVELQGDHREKIRQFFQKENWIVKG